MKRIAFAVLAVLCACTGAPPEAAPEQRPQQAGQALDPVVTAARIAAARGAALTGNQAAVQQQVHALNEDIRRSMKLPDGTRPIDHEAARSAARTIPGVRSVAWIDRQNLLALVEGPDARTYDTIDRICLALEPLGDTLAVVVNLQNAVARNGGELEILSRNCQLAPGDRALFQARRQVDVVAPEVRAQHRAAQERMREALVETGSGSLTPAPAETPTARRGHLRCQSHQAAATMAAWHANRDSTFPASRNTSCSAATTACPVSWTTPTAPATASCCARRCSPMAAGFTPTC